jgi:hypothetical protein
MSGLPDLDDLTIAQLRAEWRKVHKGKVMPQGLGRDLASRGIAWRRQEKSSGSYSPAVRRELDRLAKELAERGDIKLAGSVRLKPGTKLVREWRGRVYQVLVLEEGFRFEDRSYRSLTQIARNITGAAWSGPRFFGLKGQSDASR